jgi:transcriptional regulator of nitric oxide reductase
MPSTYTLISSNVLSSSAASVTFSAIPNTYTDLVVRWSARSDRANVSDTMKLRINSDSGSNYSWTYLLGSGAVASSSINSGLDYTSLGAADAATAASNTFANGELYIPNYLASTKKPLSTINAQEDNATNAQLWVLASLWQGTAAITSLQLFLNIGPNFVSGSSFYLYGVKSS